MAEGFHQGMGSSPPELLRSESKRFPHTFVGHGLRSIVNAAGTNASTFVSARTLNSYDHRSRLRSRSFASGSESNITSSSAGGFPGRRIHMPPDLRAPRDLFRSAR